MTALVRVLALARRHLAWLGVAALSMVLVASSTVFAYNLIRPVYDDLLRPDEPARQLPQIGLVAYLDQVSAQARAWLVPVLGSDRTAILVLVLVAIVIKNLFSFLSRYAVAHLGLATIRDLRNRIYDALLGQSQSYFQGTASGVLIARVVNDVEMIREALSERFGDLLQDSLTVVVLLVYVLTLNPGLALATLVLAPVLMAPVIHFSRRLRKRSRESQERIGELTSILDETLKGVRVVQSFGMESFEQARFRRATFAHLQANLKARAIQAANAPVMEIVGAIGFLALIAYASSQIARGAMTIGDLSAFLLGVYGTYNPLKRLNKLNLSLQQAAVAAQRVLAVIDAPVAVRDRAGARHLDDLGDGVRLDGVSFSYDGERTALQRLDLHIPVGSTVALVGPSGAGKSTVAQLIPRFWDVTAGAVRIGGFDVKDLTLASLRAQIGLVTQETILFNDSVRANIAYGRQDIDQEVVMAAAKAALAHDFIGELPDGYDTVIGEAGSKLSGGQRQRLAVARALLKDPQLLILDEATSALDAEAERLVQQALDRLMQGRTTLVIAHRLSAVRRADLIVVLDQGRVVEQGRHDELLAAGGVYQRMVRLQEGDSSSDGVV
jgi:subfamily B ATP-binding cassette protein MsbA